MWGMMLMNDAEKKILKKNKYKARKTGQKKHWGNRQNWNGANYFSGTRVLDKIDHLGGKNKPLIQKQKNAVAKLDWIYVSL